MLKLLSKLGKDDGDKEIATSLLKLFVKLVKRVSSTRSKNMKELRRVLDIVKIIQESGYTFTYFAFFCL